jgi:hypothetical protein
VCVGAAHISPRRPVRAKQRYGIDDQGWFLRFHCITNYAKVAFLNGTSLRPLPPVASKNARTRYLHIHEGDRIDEELVGSWVRQAAELPGEECF